MRKLKFRLFLDAVLGLIIVVEMFVQVTGIFFHEIFGFSLVLLLLLHLIIERKWIRAVIRGARFLKLKHLNLVKAVVVSALVLSILAMMMSSVAISTILRDYGLNASLVNDAELWTFIHSASAYALCMLTVIHLALHWALIFNCFRIPYNPQRRYAIGIGVGALSCVCLAALGFNANKSFVRIGYTYGAFGEVSNSSNPEVPELNDGLNMPSNGEKEKQNIQPESNTMTDEGNSSSGKEEQSAFSSRNDEPSISSVESEGTLNPSNTQETSSENATNVSDEAYCPLCPKRCSLSAPRCNRPYRVGLI